MRSHVSAFAGGFGSESSSSSKPKKKIKGGEKALQEMVSPITPSKLINEPRLDRFGLPIRTADNFFPPLPSDAVIVGCDSTKTTKDLITSCITKYLPLNLDFFDDNCIEKKSDDFVCERWRLKLLHFSPPVIEIENFMTSKECEEYIHITQNDGSSVKVNSATFSTFSQSKRTSTTWFCHFSQVSTLLAKCKRLLNIDLHQLEEAQIVRYKTGDEFSWHYDEIPSSQLHNGGQRIATLLVYLNSIERGGGTIFRDLKDPSGNMLTMRPKQGSALLFFPAFSNGTPDDRTLHKGEVAVEEKWIAQIWIHERQYVPVIPEGNSHAAALDAIHEKEIELGYI